MSTTPTGNIKITPILLKAMFILLVIAHVITTAQIFDNMAPYIARGAFVLIFVLCALSIGVAFAQRAILPFAWGGGLLALLVVQAMVFSINDGAAIDLLPISSFAAVLIFVPLSIIRLSTEWMFRCIATIATIYIAVYIVMALRVGSAPHIGPVTKGVMVGYQGRDARLAQSQAYVLFALVYSIRNGAGNKIISLVVAVAAGVAIYLGGSRVFQGVCILIAVMAFARLNQRVTVKIALVAWGLAVAGLLWGVVATEWNPYGFFGRDISADIRRQGYEVIRHYIVSKPFFGLGIPSSADAADALLSSPVGVYASDYGLLGIWLALGAAGVAVYVWFISICARAVSKGRLKGGGGRWQLMMGDLAIYLIIYSATSPILVTGSGTLLFCLIAAITMREGANRGVISSPSVHRELDGMRVRQLEGGGAHFPPASQ